MNYTDLTIPKTQQHPPAQTRAAEPPRRDAEAEPRHQKTGVVVVPPCLRNLNVEPILAPLPPAHRQTVLDTYAARHDWGKQHGAPVALPAAMLHALVNRQQAGTLDTTQAEKLARRREMPATNAPPPRSSNRATALDALKQARAALGGRRLN